MPLDIDMDFNLADKVAAIAVRHARAGTPIEKAWPEVVAAARKKLGASLSRSALELPITGSLVWVTATFAALLARDRPDRKVKGLWFGLVELIPGKSLTDTIFTPYLSGSPEFNPRNEDWPCAPIWMPEDCYATNLAMYTLSKWRKRHKKQSWLIDTTLIEPLNTLFCGCIARNVSPDLLLGPAPTRGIGCGFDSGDLRTLGTVDKNGFKPLRSR
jgi:hypothetical protein